MIDRGGDSRDFGRIGIENISALSVNSLRCRAVSRSALESFDRSCGLHVDTLGSLVDHVW